MPQAGIITIRLEAFFVYGIGDTNRLRFKIACYFLYPYTARLPNSSSMRSNWLYFAIRSLRLSEPVLICPLLVATAMSAMVASSVSPERWAGHSGIAVTLSHLNSIQSFGQRTDLIYFY